MRHAPAHPKHDQGVGARRDLFGGFLGKEPARGAGRERAQRRGTGGLEEVAPRGAPGDPIINNYWHRTEVSPDWTPEVEAMFAGFLEAITFRLFEGYGKATVSPLTPALSPLRGEGARRASLTSRTPLAAFGTCGSEL